VTAFGSFPKFATPADGFCNFEEWKFQAPNTTDAGGIPSKLARKNVKWVKLFGGSLKKKKGKRFRRDANPGTSGPVGHEEKHETRIRQKRRQRGNLKKSLIQRGQHRTQVNV